VVQQNTLHHGETLLVVTTSDLEDVTLPLVAESVDLNFLGDALVVENAQLALISDVDELLAASSRIGDVELHQKLAPLLKKTKEKDGCIARNWQ